MYYEKRSRALVGDGELPLAYCDGRGLDLAKGCNKASVCRMEDGAGAAAQRLSRSWIGLACRGLTEAAEELASRAQRKSASLHGSTLTN